MRESVIDFCSSLYLTLSLFLLFHSANQALHIYYEAYKNATHLRIWNVAPCLLYGLLKSFNSLLCVGAISAVFLKYILRFFSYSFLTWFGCLAVCLWKQQMGSCYRDKGHCPAQWLKIFSIKNKIYAAHPALGLK